MIELHLRPPTLAHRIVSTAGALVSGSLMAFLLTTVFWVENFIALLTGEEGQIARDMRQTFFHRMREMRFGPVPTMMELQEMGRNAADLANGPLNNNVVNITNEFAGDRVKAKNGGTSPSPRSLGQSTDIYPSRHPSSTDLSWGYEGEGGAGTETRGGEDSGLTSPDLDLETDDRSHLSSSEDQGDSGIGMSVFGCGLVTNESPEKPSWKLPSLLTNSNLLGMTKPSPKDREGSISLEVQLRQLGQEHHKESIQCQERILEMIAKDIKELQQHMNHILGHKKELLARHHENDLPDMDELEELYELDDDLTSLDQLIQSRKLQMETVSMSRSLTMDSKSLQELELTAMLKQESENPKKLAWTSKDMTTGKPTATVKPMTSSRRPSPPLASPILMTICSMILFSSSLVEGYDVNKREYDPGLVSNTNLTVFDCSKPSLTTWRAIDLTEVGKCPDAVHDYLEPENLTAALVQAEVPIPVTIYRCDVRVSRVVQEHGWDWGLAKHRQTDDKVRIVLNGDMCRAAFELKKFRCPTSVCGGVKNSPILDLKIGEEIQATYESNGDFDKKGYADASSFDTQNHDGTSSEHYGVHTVTLTVMIQNYTAFVDFSTKKIWSDAIPFQANYGLHGKAVSHVDYGTIAWDEIEYQCKMQLAHIATTNATVRMLKEEIRPGNGKQRYAGAMAIIVDHKEKRVSGMVISENRHPCLPECFTTNVPQLLFCVGADVNGIDEIESRASAKLNAARINQQAQGTYLELTHELDLFSLHKRLQQKICDLDLRTTKQDFAFLLSGQAQYALHGLNTGIAEYPVMGINDTSFTVTLRGSVAYFAECPKETARVVALPKCSLQIPIVRENGNLSWADPINHHIIDYPTWVDCDDALRVQHRIGEHYYCQGVNVHERCPQGTLPVVIQPSIGAVRGVLVDQLPPLGGLTINPNQLQRIAESQRIAEMGRVIVDSIVSKVMYSTDKLTRDQGYVGIYFGAPLDDLDIAELAHGVAFNLFYLFRVFGYWYLNFFGVFVAASILKHLLDTLVRLWHIYRIHGAGWYMWRALYASFFATWSIPTQLLMTAKEVIDKSLEQARDDAIRPPTVPKLDGLVDQHDDLKNTVAQMRNSINTMMLMQRTPTSDLKEPQPTAREKHFINQLGVITELEKELEECSDWDESSVTSTSTSLSSEHFNQQYRENVFRTLQRQHGLTPDYSKDDLAESQSTLSLASKGDPARHEPNVNLVPDQDEVPPDEKKENVNNEGSK